MIEAERDQAPHLRNPWQRRQATPQKQEQKNQARTNHQRARKNKLHLEMYADRLLAMATLLEVAMMLMMMMMMIRNLRRERQTLILQALSLKEKNIGALHDFYYVNKLSQSHYVDVFRH